MEDEEVAEPPKAPPCLAFYRDGLCLDERCYKSHNPLALVVDGVPGEGSADKARAMGLLFAQYSPCMAIMTTPDEGCVLFSRQEDLDAALAWRRIELHRFREKGAESKREALLDKAAEQLAEAVAAAGGRLAFTRAASLMMGYNSPIANAIREHYGKFKVCLFCLCVIL